MGRRCSRARSPLGCGSQCCSPILPRLSPKGAARRKPTLGGVVEGVNALDLRLGDVVLVEANEIIPGDGEILEGVASVNESAITGESAPVIREAGGDRSAVTGGTTVLSDFIKVRITAAPG